LARSYIPGSEQNGKRESGTHSVKSWEQFHTDSQGIFGFRARQAEPLAAKQIPDRELTAAKMRCGARWDSG